MVRILIAGNDSRLLATRAAVLLKTGAAVVYRDTMGTLGILDREAFDLVVLCHSLPETDVAVILDKVHQRIPDAKIFLGCSALYVCRLHTNNKIGALSAPAARPFVPPAEVLPPIA